jgi:hypothetical protein
MLEDPHTAACRSSAISDRDSKLRGLEDKVGDNLNLGSMSPAPAQNNFLDCIAVRIPALEASMRATSKI